MGYLAENSGSPWTTHMGRVAWSSRTGSSKSSHYQPCHQGAIEGNNTGWIEFRQLQRKEITHADWIKVLSRISRMPHHIPYPQFRRPSFAYLPILYGREDWPQMFSALAVHSILPPENNASKSPCCHRVFYTLADIIIETVFKQQLFGGLRHYYGTIEYQGRGTPHIHLTV